MKRATGIAVFNYVLPSAMYSFATPLQQHTGARQFPTWYIPCIFIISPFARSEYTLYSSQSQPSSVSCFQVSCRAEVGVQQPSRFQASCRAEVGVHFRQWGSVCFRVCLFPRTIALRTAIGQTLKRYRISLGTRTG